MKTLVTGAAGFIGYHLCKNLCERGDTVVGIDNLNDYYDVNLKLARLNELKPYDQFTFIKCDIADRANLEAIFNDNQFDVVVNLAAQAGVRYSIENPHAYINANIVGFLNILENCRHHKIKNLVFASSSSVYGANTNYPFSESDNVDHPVALYAASKKSNELMAHSYASLYNLPCTGLRFFTVYGPWGRPDMALFKFTKNMLAGKPIDVYGHGKMYRDFTYIDDIISGVIKTIDNRASPNKCWNSKQADPASSYAPYAIYNIGNNNPIKLTNFIGTLETELAKKAKVNFMPIQPGDVEKTYADTTRLYSKLNYKPSTSIQAGIKKFVSWYRAYYKQTVSIDKE